MILAIDPGSEKTGIALLRADGTLVWRMIEASAKVPERAAETAASHVLTALVMGDGTHHKEMQQRVEEALRVAGYPMKTVLVDEKFTTEMGKARYLAEHPAKGLAKLLPRGMRTADEPVDDYVAQIIGEIHLGITKPRDVGHKKIK